MLCLRASLCHYYIIYNYRDLRQEVTVLAQLSHPNIVALLGVSIRPMCMVIELAPMGSLFGNLDKRLEEIKTIQALQVIPRMPGGVLGHEISTRMALQVRAGPIQRQLALITECDNVYSYTHTYTCTCIYAKFNMVFMFVCTFNHSRWHWLFATFTDTESSTVTSNRTMSWYGLRMWKTRST